MPGAGSLLPKQKNDRPFSAFNCHGRTYSNLENTISLRFQDWRETKDLESWKTKLNID